MVRFIHTADLQLGMTRRFLDEDAQARYAQARIDALVSIGELAAREDARFVVVAGDVFETNRVRPRTVGRALEAMTVQQAAGPSVSRVARASHGTVAGSSLGLARDDREPAERSRDRITSDGDEGETGRTLMGSIQ